MSLVQAIKNFLANYCRKCGKPLQPVEGWSGKQKCPNGHHPDHFSTRFHR